MYRQSKRGYLSGAALLQALSKLSLPLGIHLGQVGFRVAQVQVSPHVVVLVHTGLEGQLCLLLHQSRQPHLLLHRVQHDSQPDRLGAQVLLGGVSEVHLQYGEVQTHIGGLYYFGLLE